MKVQVRGYVSPGQAFLEQSVWPAEFAGRRRSVVAGRVRVAVGAQALRRAKVTLKPATGQAFRGQKATRDVDFGDSFFRTGGPEAEVAIKLGSCTAEMLA